MQMHILRIGDSMASESFIARKIELGELESHTKKKVASLIVVKGR